MIILTLRTDKPEAELGVYDDQEQLQYLKWQAHRELAETLNGRIKEILNKSSISHEDLGAITCFKGPGSFTGLRIGLTTANALAYGLQIPIVAEGGEDWIQKSIQEVLDGKNDKIAIPEYGQTPNITKQKK